MLDTMPSNFFVPPPSQSAALSGERNHGYATACNGLTCRCFEALKSTPRICGIGTFNHQGMPLGHASSRDAFHLECYLPTHPVSHFTLLSSVQLILFSGQSPIK